MELPRSKSKTALFLFAAALLFFGIRVYLIHNYGVMTPYWDDWGIGNFLSKSISSGLTFSDFYQDANEHRMMFNRILSLLLFKANQLQWDPMVSMLANSVIWSLSGVFLLRIALHHQDRINATLFIALILFLWSFPLAFVNIIWGIQTHTYTMIAFSLLGCWYSGYRVLSLKWWLGIVSLGAACLTLAGGTFAAFSVVAVQTLMLLSGSQQRRKNLITLIAALTMGLFGLALILVQKSSGMPSSGEYNLISSTTSFLFTLSWPLPREIWPAFIFITPVMALAIQSLRTASIDQPLVRFSLCLYGFIVIIAIAVAYARGYTGEGPARRYFEFLALSSVASFLALLLLQNEQSKINETLFRVFVSAWIIAFIVSTPWNTHVVKLSIEKHKHLRAIQTKLVKNYLNSRDISWFQQKPFEHVPFPHVEAMDDVLNELSKTDVLPYRLQTTKTIRRNLDSSRHEVKASPFILNGVLKVHDNNDDINSTLENVFGSYKPADGGMNATGSFVSEVLELKRPYVSISVSGYFGYPGMELQLVNEISGDTIDIVIDKVDSKYAEFWREILTEVPRGYYRLIAQDNNPELWFGFSTPKTVGRLSYWTQRILEYSFWYWRVAVLLLVLVFIAPISNLFYSSLAVKRELIDTQ